MRGTPSTTSRVTVLRAPAFRMARSFPLPLSTGPVTLAIIGPGRVGWRVVKLQVYVLRQLIVSLAFSVGGILLVALPGIAVRTMQEIPSAEVGHLAQFLAMSLQNLVPYALPICFLLATVATFGRLAADKEWIAIQMAGVRPIKLLVPPLAVGLVLALFSWFLLAVVVPGGRDRLRRLAVEATSSALADLGPGGTSFSFSDGVVLEALWSDPETGLLHEVFLRKSGGDQGEDFYADSARITIEGGELRAELHGVLMVQRTDSELWQGVAENLEVRQTLDAPVHRIRPRYLTSPQMSRLLEEGQVPDSKVARYRLEIHYRRALAAVFIIFGLIGPATGLIARRGTQLGALAISSGYSLLHYLLQMQVAKDLGMNGTLDPAAAAWMPIAVSVLPTIWLVRKAMRR
jgi:lipopolysaccharide export LptBFGC system permease protein LptF